MNLHIYQLFLIFLTSDQPQDIPLASGAKKAELSSPYTTHVTMKMNNSIKVIITINCLIEILGHTHNPIDSNIFSFLAPDGSYLSATHPWKLSLSVSSVSSFSFFYSSIKFYSSSSLFFSDIYSILLFQ